MTMVKPKEIEMAEIDCVALGASDKAFKIEVLKGKKKHQLWIAKSILNQETKQGLEDANEGEAMTIEVPLWLAEKEKLV